MNRALLALAATLLLAGCQHPAWQNPYAMIGPATVPPPSATTSAEGYYPAGSNPESSTRTARNDTIRSEISDSTIPKSEAATPSFSASGEPPIRIVEATPAAKPKANVAPVKAAAPAPLREPATTTPKAPTSGVRRDPSVAPVSFQASPPTFVETTTAARGQWRVR
jgi:hypothetical protein